MAETGFRGHPLAKGLTALALSTLLVAGGSATAPALADEAIEAAGTSADAGAKANEAIEVSTQADRQAQDTNLEVQEDETSAADDSVVALETQASNKVTYRVASWDKTNQQVTYTDKTATGCVTLGSGTTSWQKGKTYVVPSGGVTISGRVTVSGTVNLILTDGAKLTARKGINVRVGNTLNIYGQSAGTGTLVADASTAYETFNAAGIGGTERMKGGAINVHGGNVVAKGGGGGGAGIGGAIGTFDAYDNSSCACGPITIYGGTVTAQGGNDAAGIGSGWSTVKMDDSSNDPITIYGGTVTAKGGKGGAGIGGGTCVNGGEVTIYGGNVTATGNNDSAGIGGGGGGGGGTTTIYGGTVVATGASRTNQYGTAVGAGIGAGGIYANCGYQITSGKTLIYGGWVIATAGADGYEGIGFGSLDGYNASPHTLVIGSGLWLHGCEKTASGESEHAVVLSGETTSYEGYRPREMSVNNLYEEGDSLAKTKGLSTVCRPAKSTINVSWSEVEGATRYQVQWRVRGGKWKTKKSYDTSLTLKNAKAGKLYEVRVRAAAGIERGAWSRVVRRWYKRTTGVSASSTAKGRVKVRWSKTKGANAGYVVYVRNAKTGKMIAKKAVKASRTSVTIKGLKSGKKVQVSVRPMKSAKGTSYTGVLSTKASTKVK